MPGWGFIILVIIAAGLLICNFLPFVVAFSRGHQDSAAIFIFTLFLGWTIIGWIVALVWSLTTVEPRIVDRG